jgi:hypothetical protein
MVIGEVMTKKHATHSGHQAPPPTPSQGKIMQDAKNCVADEYG